MGRLPPRPPLPHGLRLPQVHTTDFPGNYPGYDDAWDPRRFEEVSEGGGGGGAPWSVLV